MTKQYYLREDVYVNPLVNKWYAWPYLIPPVTYAMYAIKTHKRLMNSFVNNFELHILANQTGQLAGAEFVNCSAEQVDEVRTLINRIDDEFPMLNDVVQAVAKLDEMMTSHKTSTTIEYIYEQLPAQLKGFIEITMDLYHQPNYRLIEGLLYKSELYRKDFQSVSLAILDNEFNRPFVYSTPILPTTDNLHIELPFESPWWDDLFSSRLTPISEEQIQQMFEGVETRGGLDVMNLFTETAPEYLHEAVHKGVKLTYTGHAGLMIESSDKAILIDPVIAARTGSNAGDLISYSQLPKRIDYVILTHNHSDHVHIETLLQLRHKVDKVVVPINSGGTLIDPSLKLILEQVGFDVLVVNDMEEIKLGDDSIMALPFVGEHGDLNIRSKTAWLINMEGKNIYAGADSSNLDPDMYRHIKKVVGHIDVLAIGMECVGAPYTWFYGALTTTAVPKEAKESRRLNGSDFDKARHMVDTFEPDYVMIYALGIEPWFNYFMGLDYNENSEQIVQSGQLVSYCEENNILIKLLKARFTHSMA